MNIEITQPTRYWNFTKISPNVLELHIRGTIGGPELSYSILKTAEWNLARMRRMISEFGRQISEIHVKINSGGGISAEGQGIYELLKNHPAKKFVTIEYFCGSVASVICMVGDRIFMRANGRFFMHESKSFCIGSASDFLLIGHTMAKLERKTRQIYTKRTGLTDKRVERILFRETFLSAQEALELGFIDEILPPSPAAEKEFGNYTTPNSELLDHKCLQCVYKLWRGKALKDESKSDDKIRKEMPNE